MNHNPPRKLIKSLFKKGNPLSQKDISKSIDMDKSKLSGYLQAMADYGDLSLKKYGNSYVYSRKARRKK
jgi:Mn-dependent DtxR family transcriptional regulator